MKAVSRSLAVTAAAATLVLSGAVGAVADESPAPVEPVAPAESTESSVAEPTTAASPEQPPTGAVQTGLVYGTLTVSPSGPWTSGQVVTLSYTGMNPPDGAQGGFFIGYCVGNGQPQMGPNSCGPISESNDPVDGTWYQFGVNSLPDGSVTFRIPEQGANAGFVDYPNWICDNGDANECLIVVGDFNGDGPAQIPIVYGTATASPSPSTPGGSTSGGSTSGGEVAGGGESLADTGAGSTTGIAATGLALLIAGAAVLVIARHRNAGNADA